MRGKEISSTTQNYRIAYCRMLLTMVLLKEKEDNSNSKQKKLKLLIDDRTKLKVLIIKYLILN